MTDLDQPIWNELKGAYGSPYNAAPVLRALETASSDEEGPLWATLWEELYHQGDIGEAAYFAVPHLVRIAGSKPVLTPETFTFVAVVELERPRQPDPEPPARAAEAYRAALESLPNMIATHPHRAWSAELAQAICAALAATRGQGELARAVLELDPETTRAFLKEQIGYDPESEG